MLDRSVLGRRGEAVVNEVERGAVRRFARALGLTDPVHTDEQAAAAAGHRGLLAPPTFPVSFRSSIELREALGLSEQAILQADQALELLRPICSGDRISVVASIVEIGEREGAAGAMETVIVEDEGRDQQGNLVYRGRKTFVVRPPPREV